MRLLHVRCIFWRQTVRINPTPSIEIWLAIGCLQPWLGIGSSRSISVDCILIDLFNWLAGGDLVDWTFSSTETHEISPSWTLKFDRFNQFIGHWKGRRQKVINNQLVLKGKLVKNCFMDCRGRDFHRGNKLRRWNWQRRQIWNTPPPFVIHHD